MANFPRAAPKPLVSKRGPPDEVVQLDVLLIQGLELQSTGLGLQIASMQVKIDGLTRLKARLMLERQVHFKDLLHASVLDPADSAEKAETSNHGFLKLRLARLEKKIVRVGRELARLNAELTELRKQKLHIDRRVNAEKGLS